MEDFIKGMDIVSVLKVGLPGLVFLLSLLSYRLLANEQQNPTPRKAILDSIRKYTYLNLTFALLTVAAPIAELAHSPVPKSQSFAIRLVVSDTLEEGNAAVCNGEDYASRYLLLKSKSSDRLVQVFSKSIIPCSGEIQIAISRQDATHLGWTTADASQTATVVPALAGYKFVI